MFEFLFLCLCIQSSIFVVGDTPRIVDSLGVNVSRAENIEISKGKLFIVEESKLLEIYKPDMNEVCAFQEPVPFKYHVFSNSNSKFKNSFKFDGNNIQNNQQIALQFYANGYELNNDDPYYIVSTNEKYESSNSNIHRENISFLNQIYTSFHVFGQSSSETLRKLCPTFIGPYKKYIHMGRNLMIVCAIVCFIYTSQYMLERRKVRHIWVFTQNYEILFGTQLSKLDTESAEIISDVVRQAGKSKSRVNCIKKIIRLEQTFISIRVEARLLINGNILVYMWHERIPLDDGVKFSCELKSESHFCIEPPRISFSSFRDFNPYHINFTLNNNTKCHIDLSASAFAPFQPYGKLVSMSVIAFNDLRLMINHNPFNGSNFQRISTSCSRILGAYHTLFYDENNNIIFQYTMPGQRKLTEKELSDIPTRVPKDFTSAIIKDFLGPTTQCFISRISSPTVNVLAVIDIGSFEDDGIFESFGFSYFCLCCLFSYQLSVSKEMQQQYDRASDLLSMVKEYTIMEFIDDKIEYLKSTNKIMSESMTKSKSRESMDKELSKQNQLVVGANLDINNLKPGDYIAQKIMKYVDGGYFMIDAVRYKEEENTVTVVSSETVTDIINHEGVLITSVRNAEEMYDEFHVHTFRIENNKFILSDDSLEDEISKYGLPNDYCKSNSLSDFVIPSDTTVLTQILEGKSGLPVRIKCLSVGYVWYLMYSNQKEGFLFNINKYIHPKNRLEYVKCEVEPPIYFWRLDETNDKVISVHSRPTIWDALCVSERDKKFSELREYLHPSMSNVLDNFYEMAKNKYEEELLIRKNNNEYEWYQLTASCRDDGIYCTLSPMQRLRELNTALNETQKLHDILLLGGKVVLWRFSDDRNPLPPIRSITPRHSKILRMNWSTVDEQVHEDYKEQFAKKLRQAIDESGWIESDLPIISDGVETWVSVRGQGDCFARRIIGVLIDITDNRNAFMELEEKGQAAEQANREKTQFLANMSHEIRTPMNGIFGMLDVLAYQELTQEQRLLVDSIRSSSFQLMRLLDDTLNLSKIEQGELESTPTTVNLLKIIEPTMIANSSRARMSKISFSIIVSKNFPTLVYTDSQLIMQIINNLLSNALKFTKKGGVTLKMKWDSTPTSDNEYLVVSVSDTGIGISEEQKKVIFERFMQAETSTSRYYGGTGLGLPLVQEIARFLGGNVDVQSTPGEGSTFIVRIPMQSLMLPYSPPFTDNQKRIVWMLINNTQLRDSLTEWLECHHYSVVYLSSSQDIAEQSAKSHPFLLFVEGNNSEWNDICKVVSSQKKPFPVCSFCDPGECSPFKYALVKPVIPTHVLHLLNSLRYNKHDIVNTNLIVGNRDDQSRRILVVEDNKQNQFVMQKILEKLNCDYVIANNGQEAIQILGQDNFDLVFMDCQMPILNGIDATKIIRRSGKHYSTVAIVALTASAVEGDELTCREAGMDGYLAKPVRMQQIMDILKKFPPH